MGLKSLRFFSIKICGFCHISKTVWDNKLKFSEYHFLILEDENLNIQSNEKFFYEFFVPSFICNNSIFLNKKNKVLKSQPFLRAPSR